MLETTVNPLVEAITEQLKTLSVEELRTIQNFVGYIAWKHQRDVAPKKSAEERAIERLKDEDDPSKWITVIEEGDEVDEEALNNWLKARGYQG